ncbi:MAG: DUF6879 family protein [Mycobacteriales bacterium]
MEFTSAWRRVRSQVLKVESWQVYQEPETQSLQAYLRGDFDQVEFLLEKEADLDREVYEGVRSRGTPFIRVRLARFPLTGYLTFEMWNYVVRERRGETIEIVDLSSDPRPLPNPRYFDFLLFDQAVALIHDYGTDGLQVGGWLTTSTRTIEHLSTICADLRKRSTPLAAAIRSHDIKFRPPALVGGRQDHRGRG